MSKSLGNFVTIRELLQGWEGYAWPGEALRFNMLRTHYRQPIDWTLDTLDDAHKTLWGWYGDLQSVAPAAGVPAQILEALADDLNTAQTITELHALYRAGKRAELGGALRFLGFSLDRQKIARAAAGASAVESGIAAKTESLIAARAAARARKDFKESDRIRDELAKMGVVLKDGKDKDGNPVTTWEIAR
jgi:cysteinyl-tRNA synthetase